MPQSYRSSSVYSDGHSDGFSSTSSQWSTTYRKLPKKQKQPTSLRFLFWTAGAPRDATGVKKRTREIPDDRSDMSGWSSGSYFSQPDTQMSWVTTPNDRYYYSGSSSSGRSSGGHSNRSGRSNRKGGGSRQKHFNGAVPNPMPPPPPGFGPSMDGHFAPPPPSGMGGPFPVGGFPPPPPPPPPAAAGGAPAFFDVSGQHQPGNPFNGGGPPAGGFHPDVGDYDEEYDSDSTE